MNRAEEPMETNRKRWDHLASIHVDSDFYDVEAFLAGGLSLKPVEIDEVGDVRGKSMLHLQCHFGLDTLSWARLGATVTGMDYSQEAISTARRLSADSGVHADFVCSNVYDLPRALSGEFDIVFASYGVLCWLPDLPRWSQIAAGFLKSGGVFYLIDSHPFMTVFDNDEGVTDFKVVAPYFHSPEPLRFEGAGSYATADAKVQTSYEWTHSMSDILDSIIDAGLNIEFLHEFPHSEWSCMPFMERGDDGRWRLPDEWPALPLVFSVKASKA